MQRDRNRPVQRSVMLNEPEQHEGRPDTGLDHDPHGREQSKPAHFMARGKKTPRPHPDAQHEQQAQSGGSAVGKLDQGLVAGDRREHLAVAKRPVRTAPRTRARGPHERTPKDHADHENEGKQGEPGKPQSAISAIGHVVSIRYDKDVNQTVEASVFPIEGVVFFPSLTLPLNIFEPRYILMVNDCLESGRPLAVTDLDPAPGAVVGMGDVQLFEKRTDGTLVILVRGTHRARITRIMQNQPYFRADVEQLEESSTLEQSNRFLLQRLRSGLDEWAAQTLPDAASRQAFLEGLEDPRRLVETYAHFKILDADIRQELLEADSLDARVELLRRVI